MAWHLTDDVHRYLSAAGEFLRARPAENTVLLTAAETIRASGPGTHDEPPLFGWWTGPDEAVSAACMHTPLYPVALSGVSSEIAAALAGALAGAGRAPAGVNGDTGAAQAFADAWQARTGCQVTVLRRTRLYRLGQLTQPDPPPPGAARIAGPADRELLLAWLTAFGHEVGEPVPATERMVEDRLSYGGFFFWAAGGRPVSLAGMTRQVAGQARIGPVYTPPELRQRGYAAGVTAAVSQAALDAGAREVVLFADLANPTSNALYQRLGYQPLGDSVVLLFRPPGPQP